MSANWLYLILINLLASRPRGGGAVTELRYRRLSPRRWVWFTQRDGRWEREREDKLSPEERRRVEELLEELNAAPGSDP